MSGYTRKLSRTTSGYEAAVRKADAVPGKRTLVEELRGSDAPAPVQRSVSGTARPEAVESSKALSDVARPTIYELFGGSSQRGAVGGHAGDRDTTAIHASAQRGIATSASPLPHAETIQRSFGRHDISGIQAHTGPEAAAAAQDMGAKAYATGNHVVLGHGADLHTVAHEAAHIVQQRGGVQLQGGVGQADDPYERHADAVADMVVRGQSAQTALDDFAPAGGGPEQMAPAADTAGMQRQVQRRTDMDDEAKESARNISDTANEMIARHKGDPAGLATDLLGHMSDFESSQVCYRVFERAPDKAGLFTALAAQLPNDRLRTLSGSGNTFINGVLMAIPRYLREVGNTAECERMIGILVDPEHAHLVGETPVGSAAVQGALPGHNATIQSINGGWGPIVYDYYWIIMDAMPPTLTAEAYLTEMSQDLNAAVHDDTFNSVNVFERTKQDKQRGAPQVGDVYDIDIKGPDNGSVMLIERTPNHFIFQTVTVPQTGTHPEYGSREFGFELIDGGAVKWYTRGASRPGSEVAAIIGGPIQEKGWTAMLTGIGNTLADRGGKLRTSSFGHWIRRG